VPIKVTFEIPDGDLEYFRATMRDAQAKVRGADEAQIIDAARRQARAMRSLHTPSFVRERVTALENLIRMLEDADWGLESEHRERVLGALAYFVEPNDLIPDAAPGIGLLDDAILVELLVQDLRPELEAYQGFCAFRESQEGERPEVRAKRLAARRLKMYARMQRRREQRERRGGLFALFH
jgi:uncharacterized membrane protein YkvA (DUF1232 family)